MNQSLRELLSTAQAVLQQRCDPSVLTIDHAARATAMLAEAAELLRAAGWDPADLSSWQSETLHFGGPESPLPLQVYDSLYDPKGERVWLCVDRRGGDLVAVIRRGRDDSDVITIAEAGAG